jgi:hypothetical protein
MSWSVLKMGTREKVRLAVEADFDKHARSYEGTEEERDLIAAKERVLSAIDATSVAGDSYSPDGYGVSVDCSGTRSVYNVNIRLDVKRIALAI